MSSLEKCLFSSLAHFSIGSFIFLELSCMSCLYIFEINSLSVALSAVIFSHSEGCLFTLLIVSFIVQKILSLIRSHLFILLLFPLLWEVGHRGSCRWILYHLSHQGSPRILEWAAYPFSRGSSQHRNWTRVSYIAGGLFTRWAIREVLILLGRGSYFCY